MPLEVPALQWRRRLSVIAAACQIPKRAQAWQSVGAGAARHQQSISTVGGMLALLARMSAQS